MIVARAMLNKYKIWANDCTSQDYYYSLSLSLNISLSILKRCKAEQKLRIVALLFYVSTRSIYLIRK